MVPASLHYQPVLPLSLILVLAGLAAGMTLVRALRGRPLHPAWMHWPAALLRLAVIGILALILLNPSEQISTPGKSSHAVVLLDRSASMSLAGEGDRTRWEEALAWTQALRTSLKSAGQPEPAVRAFAADSQPLAWDATVSPDGQETRLAAALESLASSAGSENVSHVIAMSDGCIDDAPRLSSALAALRSAGISVSSRIFGRDVPARNASLVSVLPPRMVRAQSRVIIPVEIQASGFAEGTDLNLILRDDGGADVLNHSLRLPGAGDNGTASLTHRLSFTSPPRTTGYSLELSGPVGEATLLDNRFSFSLEVVSTKLRVLLAEGTHAKRTLGTSGHSVNEIEMITAALAGTGEIECTVLTPLSQYTDGKNLFGVKFVNGEMLIDQSTGFPATREEVNSYDVIMISDVPVGNFSEEQMTWVVDWVVDRGGGFIMAGGNTAFDTGNYDKTPWEKITPVDMLDYGDGHYGMSFEITIPASVRNHPIWQILPDPQENQAVLDTHPMFLGMNRVRRAKPGAIVLASVKAEPAQPVIAAQNYGRGRSIAHLPDPNGGWGEAVIRWSPDNAPSLGERLELGHGSTLTLQADAAKAPAEERPPYPSTYYASFWVNTVRWLAENSIRWRRDKLSGKIAVIQARPGALLPVAAEFLAETDPAKLALQDIGARLDVPGGLRVRLGYDRDLREFTGVLPVPADYSGAQIQVLFDTVSKREALTDAVSCGVLMQNSEFTRSAPDAALMAGLAEAGGGLSLTTPESAVAVCQAAAAARSASDSRVWPQPAWSTWPWWSTILGLLGLEWLLRRLGRRTPELRSPVIA